jgi:THAP4-like, heme-binding beta-barrel domain
VTGTLPSVLEPLAFLLGTWQGEGQGRYPTIEDFTYREETQFVWPGKPVVAYQQRTWVPPEGPPSHAEVGYLRPAPGGAELVLAHPSGVVEVSGGTVTGTRLELVSLAVLTTPTAKSVTEVRRTYERRGEALWYRLDMAAVGEPLDFHLEAELHPS